MGKVKSYKSPSGRTVHYNERGQKIGVSYQSPSGRVTHYDAQGNRTGTSYSSSSGRTVTHKDSTSAPHKAPRSSKSSQSDEAAGCLILAFVAWFIFFFILNR